MLAVPRKHKKEVHVSQLWLVPASTTRKSTLEPVQPVLRKQSLRKIDKWEYVLICVQYALFKCIKLDMSYWRD